MPKIAMIGAGSQIFCKTLSMDIMATPALKDTEIWLMSRTKPKIERMEKFLKKVVRENKLPTKIYSTLDRKKALDGADFVIVMIQVGGLDAFKIDYEVPLKYGVDQCIGDSLGAGGIFRGLRTIPVLVEIAEDMRKLCPNALLLNYSNPMAANCFALGKAASDIQSIGLCHGVQTTLDLLSRYSDVPKENIDYLCAGINHMAWFLKLEDGRTGKDINPLIMKNIEKPEYYLNEKVRCEVARHFGYFMTESTGHLSEYVPWFRKNKKALDLYCDQPAFGGESGAYYKYCAYLAEKFGKIDYLEFEDTKLAKRSVEYCSYILEAKTTGVPFKLNGNIRNDGYITNLPEGCCVEVPVFVDNQGVHPVKVGNLPVQCAALNMTNVLVQQLAVEASLTGNPENIMHAVAMDPLTSAVCTLAEAMDMASEMLEEQREWLPQFKGKKITAKPPVRIPRNLKPVDVPLDPALAIVHRFGKLAEMKGKK